MMLVARIHVLSMRSRLSLEPFRDEETQQRAHEHDQQQAADQLRQRELPADEDPQHDPELEDQVGRVELERQCGGRRGIPLGGMLVIWLLKLPPRAGATRLPSNRCSEGLLAWRGRSMESRAWSRTTAIASRCSLRSPPPRQRWTGSPWVCSMVTPAIA